VAITTGGSERLRATSDGKVGIGTSSPTANVDIAPASSTASFRIHARSDSSPVTSIEFVRGTNTTWGADTLTDYKFSVTGGEFTLEQGTSSVTSERLRINGQGRFLFGFTTEQTMHNGAFPRIEVMGDTGSSSSISASRFSANATSPGVFFTKSRSATIGTQSAVLAGDGLGIIYFTGSDGTNYIAGAQIEGEVDGTLGQTAGTFTVGQTYRILTTGTTDFTLIGAANSTPGTTFTATGAGTGTGTAINTAGDMPSRLVFSTSADNSGTPTEALRITSDKYLRMAASTGGIQFNGDTAAANALDDYEEGTWTPSQGAGLSVSGSFSSAGTYTKIGNLVYVRGTLSGSTSISVAASFALTSNLPFTVNGNSASGNATNTSVSNTAATYSANGTTTLLTTSGVTGTATIIFSFTYRV
jgi:hypothetical protein